MLSPKSHWLHMTEVYFSLPFYVFHFGSVLCLIILAPRLKKQPVSGVCWIFRQRIGQTVSKPWNGSEDLVEWDVSFIHISEKILWPLWCQLEKADIFIPQGETLKRYLIDGGSGYLGKIIPPTTEFFVVKSLALPMATFPEPTIMPRT